MTNKNIWDCAERSFSIDDSSVFLLFFCIFGMSVYTCDTYTVRITKKNYVHIKKKFLTVKP
jgi:hypothetical protein